MYSKAIYHKTSFGSLNFKPILEIFVSNELLGITYGFGIDPINSKGCIIDIASYNSTFRYKSKKALFSHNVESNKDISVSSL